jgi:NADP-dependent 3-hydroxy acid dehydrogenase YdfG
LTNDDNGPNVLTASQHQVAVVTGASSGIGAAVVHALSASGLIVHALARRETRLNELATVTGCIPHSIDLRDKVATENLLKEIPADILVNSAGVSLDQGPLHETSDTDIDEMLEINLRAGLYITRTSVIGMLARRRGHIIFIGSVAGLYPIPGSGVYSATKAAIHALSDVMRCDLLGHPVRITEIAAGRVKSEIFDRKGSGDSSATARKFFDGRGVLNASDVADAVVYAINTPPHVNISRIEILPVNQAVGGLKFGRGAAAER